MSSVTNVVISSNAQAVPLGRMLGREGCAIFEKELVRLSADPRSDWKRLPNAESTYRIAIREGLPPYVNDLTVTVQVTPGVIETREQWEYRRGDAPAHVNEAVRRLVNQTVNQPVMNVVANSIEAQLRNRLKTEVKNRALATNRTQIYAQVRAGGVR